MPTTPQRPADVELTRRHVIEVLCQRENLEPYQFPLSERPLQQAGRPCGMLFCLHGPRQSRPTAVWDGSRNTVMFYDATGRRFAQSHLLDNEWTAA
jgi:hypothetical protein